MLETKEDEQRFNIEIDCAYTVVDLIVNACDGDFDKAWTLYDEWERGIADEGSYFPGHLHTALCAAGEAAGYKKPLMTCDRLYEMIKNPKT